VIRHFSDAISEGDIMPLEREPELTHYLPQGSTLYALCGAAMNRRDHQNQPTCQECAAVLARDAEETEESRFGAPEFAPPRVFPKFNDINRTEGRGRR